MTKIYAIQLLATSVIGAYISFVLLFISRQNKLLNQLLGIYTLTLSVFYLLSFIISLKWAPDFVVLIRTFFPLYYFLPAIVYLYFRSYLQDATHLFRSDLIHTLPITLHLAYVSPLIYNLLSGQVQWAEMIAKVDRQTYFFNYGPIPDRYHVTFRLLIMVTYLLLIWKLYLSKTYRDFQKKNPHLFSSAKRWIFFYLIAETFNGLLSIIMKSRIFFLNDSEGWPNGNFISFGVVLSFDLLIVYAALHPEILFGMPHFYNSKQLTPVSIITGNQLTPSAESSTVVPEHANETVLEEHITIVQVQYDQSVISEEMRQLIQHMEIYIFTDQPFRKEKFNMETICEALQVPQHHIAYLFKQVLKKSFVDYRNELRVNYVINSLSKGLHREITIEAIGTDAGFGSKASFFTIFKKYTGKTPGQYLEG